MNPRRITDESMDELIQIKTSKKQDLIRKAIQDRLTQLGNRIIKGAKEDNEEIEKTIQVYTADSLGYVETPGGPRCGSCIWFEKDENECMWIKDRKVNGDNGCCNVWADPEHARTGEYTGKLLSASSVTNEEKSEVFFDLWNPSQLQHVIDPNDMNRTRQLVMKSWSDLTEDERKMFKENVESRFNESKNPTIEDIKKWVNGLDASKLQHFVDPDNWYLPESMELSKKKWDDMTEPEKNEMITTYSFRHGGIDVSDLLTGFGVFHKRATAKPSNTWIKKARKINVRLQKLANGSIEEGYKEPEYGEDDEPNSPQELIPQQFEKHAIIHARKLLDNTNLSHKYSEEGALKSMNHYISYQKLNLQHNHDFSRPVNPKELDNERKDSLENAKETISHHFGRGQEPGRDDRTHRVIHELFEKFKEPMIRQVPDIEGDHRKINNMLTDLSNETHKHTINNIRSLGLNAKLHQLEIGEKIEKEHAGDITAEDIAKTHLKENPKYYQEIEGINKETLLIPKKTNSKQRISIISAKLQKLAMAQETIPSFEEAAKGYETVNSPDLHKNGFTYIPHLKRAFQAQDGKQLQKMFGDGKHPLHFIAVTDLKGRHLNQEHKQAYDKLIKDGLEPTIGGYTETDGQVYTDIAFHKPMSDEQAREYLKKYHQRSSGRYDLDGSFSIFS